MNWLTELETYKDAFIQDVYKRQLQQTTELLYRCPLQRPFSAAVQKSVLLAGNYPHWLYKAGELLALAPLPHRLVTFLEQEEEPLLLRIFFLSMFTGESAYLDCLLVRCV